jgi:hypothetical protein
MPELNDDHPINRLQAIKASDWLKRNFGQQIADAVTDTPYSVDHICGIACQETAYVWLAHDKELSPEEICAICVLDGSGDFKPAENPRSAFPRNTAAFRAKYGDEFTDMLIAEGNKSRKIRGMGPVDWIYKGYGIFQYDLQFVRDDEQFFRQKLWYDFGECLKRLMKELKRVWNDYNDLFAAIKAYNGSGKRAEVYAQNVIAYAGFAGEGDTSDRVMPA